MRKKIVIFTTLMVLVSSSLRMNIRAEAATEDNIEASIEETEDSSPDIKNLDKNSSREETVKNNDMADEVDTNVKVGKINLSVLPSLEKVEVGNKVQYQIYLNLDGSVESYKDVKVEIKLPEQVDNTSVKFIQPLNELSILGIAPVLDLKNNTLTYSFDEVFGGFETSLLLEIETVNGMDLNETKLNVEAKIQADNILAASDNAEVQLVANQNASFSNKLNGIFADGKLQKRSSIRYLDEAVFGVGLSVSKFKAGSLALKDESKVILSYTLADGLEYVSDSSGVVPKREGNTYTWSFESDTNQDEEYFFFTNFEIRAKVVDDLTVFSKISNKTMAQIEFIDGSSQNYSANASVLISPNFEYELPPFVNGSALASIFSGPEDAYGNTGWINNDDISVTDGALLGWNFYLTSLGATNGKHGMNSYDVFYHPDENINIESMYSGNFYYRPAHTYPANVPMDENIYYSLSVKYTDSDEWVRTKATIVPSTYYTAEDLGIDPSRTVKTMWFHFHNNEVNVFAKDVGFWLEGNETTVFGLPSGITSTNMRIWTSVDEGYVGSIESKAGIAYSGWNNNSNRVDVQSKNVPEDVRSRNYTSMTNNFESRLAPKTAQIVSAPEGISRYVKGDIYFTNANKNLIEAGPNNLRIEITNDQASLRKLNGPFETYVLLGQGVKVGDLSTAKGVKAEIVSEDFNNTGKKLLKLIFDQDNITVSSKISGLIPVIIEEKASYQIDVELFGYLNEEFNVSDVSNTNGTFTVKELDINDFNEDGNVEEEIFVTRNSYTYRNAYEYFGLLTASTDGINYSNSTSIRKGERVKMDLALYNNLDSPISNLILIGVLPTKEDTEVLNDNKRNSNFDVNLTEPIEIPEKYKNVFDVYYSTSKEPSVAGVIDVNTASHLKKIKPTKVIDDAPWLKEKDVLDYNEIRSYKIVMKDNVKPIKDKELHFVLNTIIGEHDLTGEELIKDRIAYSSYAVGINDSSVFETQALSLIYQSEPVYSLDAKDVTMTLTDVETKIANGTFDEFVRQEANPVLIKDGKVIADGHIKMTIVDRPQKFTQGTYILEFVYDDGMTRKVLASTNSNLNIIDDDSTNPIVPKPEPEVPADNDDKPVQEIKPEKNSDEKPVIGTQEDLVNEERLPSTGVQNNSYHIYIGFIILAIGTLFVTLNYKRKLNKKQ